MAVDGLFPVCVSPPRSILPQISSPGEEQTVTLRSTVAVNLMFLVAQEHVCTASSVFLKFAVPQSRQEIMRNPTRPSTPRQGGVFQSPSEQQARTLKRLLYSSQCWQKCRFLFPGQDCDTFFSRQRYLDMIDSSAPGISVKNLKFFDENR